MFVGSRIFEVSVLILGGGGPQDRIGGTEQSQAWNRGGAWSVDGESASIRRDHQSLGRFRGGVKGGAS